jgi:hypothetical protein
MDEIISFPGRAYDYIDGQYGTVGLIVAGVMIVVAIVSVFIWFDRRK